MRAALELDHNAHPTAVRLIPQVGDGVDLFRAHQVGDALDQAGLVDLVGDLGDDNAVAVAGHLFDMCLAAQHDAPFARTIRRLDALRAYDDSPGREIRSRDELHQELDRDVVHRVVIVDEVGDRRSHFFQVMRRNVGCHAHCDS